MFRISKGNDSIGRRDPEDETADEDSPSAGPGTNVASSALRWLRKSAKPADQTSATRENGLFRLPETEIELKEPISTADPDDDSSQSDQPAETASAPEEMTPVEDDADVVAAAVEVQAAEDISELPFEFDDGDDLDDFDDLGDLDPGLSSMPGRKPPFFPDIDLNGASTPDNVDSVQGPSPSSADQKMSATEPNEIEEPSPPPSDNHGNDQAAETGAPADRDASTPEPVLQKASRPPPLEETPDSPKLEEAPIAPLEASLALQPIPELQRKAQPSVPASIEPKGEDAKADGLSENDRELNAAADDDDDDREASLAKDGDAEIDMLDLEGLELDPLEMETSDSSDDHVADDWHAHMADVLVGSDVLDENISSNPKTRIEPPERIESSSTVLPLSKTLAQLAVIGTPEARAEKPPSPAFLTRKARQKATVGKPPSTLPADRSDLSPSQLSLSVVTNVPRLRRFAAVQIGDEQIADQLMQSTIETALADPSALQPTLDLSLTLIRLLYKRRQEMLASASAPARSPEAARAFETALCRGLAGADQFEIHQFAQAINGLDERDRELLVLVALENLAYDKIADVIRVPTEQIMSLVSEARMRLRQALAMDEMSTNAETSDISTPHGQEIEIHGYLDGELDGHHMADVDALVEYDEDAADRLLHYGIQGDLIRRLYAPLLNRPVPGNMLDALATTVRPPRRGFGFSARRALSVGGLLIALGSADFWPYLV